MTVDGKTAGLMLGQPDSSEWTEPSTCLMLMVVKEIVVNVGRAFGQPGVQVTFYGKR
jgi:hypothetical protein